MMKEKGLIRNTEEVKAILEGATELRVVMKPQPNSAWTNGTPVAYRHTRKDSMFYALFTEKMDMHYDIPLVSDFEAPYQIGQRVYVKLKLKGKETCPYCGYAKKDMQIQGDHRLCKINKLSLEIVGVRVEKRDKWEWVFNFRRV